MENEQQMMESYASRQLELLLRNGLNRAIVKSAVERVSHPYKELMAYYRCAMMVVAGKFNVLSEELSLEYDRNPIETIKTRLKAPESILEKLQRRGLPVTVESIEDNIHDVAGVRVVCSYTSDIYALAETFSRQDDIHVLETKDYIRTPKLNGYRSLHLIVETPIYLHTEKRLMKVEVQFRTISMDFWASLEHKIRYKKNLPDNSDMEKELLACAELSAQLEQRMERIQKAADQYEMTE
ncbi:MAG: GTP pyrophosphokinase family protein [Clostridiales bacterium]|nr:GTP pyrophosphokinase family protein [Clostridiales bacterium]